MSDTAFDHKSFLPTLPNKPGIYRMLDARHQVLYVGKARNLRNRVANYFRSSGLETKTMAMVAKIDRIEVTVTQSETEALLLEQSLIKNDRPPYNILLRDDKSYPYIHLSETAKYPRLAIHRGAKAKHGRYFGPYPSAGAVRESLNILQKLFLLRQCDDSFFKNRSRPCLQYQIKRCSAPCVDAIQPDAYRADVEMAKLFLEGRNSAVMERFQTSMNEAAEALEFEKAARIRDQITHLRKVQERQYVHGEIGDVDVFGWSQRDHLCCVQGLFVRSGRVLGQRVFFSKNDLDISAGEFLDAFLAQYYLASTQRDIPKAIVTSARTDETDVLAAALTEKAGRQVAIVSEVRGQRARWQALASDNAEQNLIGHLADKQQTLQRFVSLQEALGLDNLPERLECFDVSHTMGEATVASCVVFNTQGPLNSDYRRFNIDDVTGGDDYAAMEQALRRRYTRLQQGEGVLPDLLIIDGGLGQIRIAIKVLTELQVTGVQILGISKGPDRKVGMERIYLAEKEVNIVGTSAAAHLLQHIRDEAHRFAITGHRQRRKKQRQKSQLDDIAGIGPTKRRRLLLHFGGLTAIKGASVEELAKVAGISTGLAGEIYRSLH